MAPIPVQSKTQTTLRIIFSVYIDLFLCFRVFYLLSLLQVLKTRYRTPLQAQAAQAKRYQTLEEFKPYGSPYFMKEEDPMKWFKSGKLGFMKYR